jgi:hypothetical protein
MHYDYSPGLGGYTEELIAIAVSTVASRASNAREAFNIFRFNKAKIEQPEVLVRIRMHDVTPAFDLAFKALKGYAIGPFAPDGKDMKSDEQIKMHDELFKRFKEAYKLLPDSAKAHDPSAPPAPSTGFRVPPTGFRVPPTGFRVLGPLGPLTADTQSDTPPAASTFPIVPVAIAAVGLVAVLLMRKK